MAEPFIERLEAELKTVCGVRAAQEWYASKIKGRKPATEESWRKFWAGYQRSDETRRFCKCAECGG